MRWLIDDLHLHDHSWGIPHNQPDPGGRWWVGIHAVVDVGVPGTEMTRIVPIDSIKEAERLILMYDGNHNATWVSNCPTQAFGLLNDIYFRLFTMVEVLEYDKN